MANTYSGDPSASDLDQVRFNIGDVADPWLLSDEEIAAVLLAVDDDVDRATMTCIRAIIAKLARSSTDRQVGNLRLSGSQVLAHYRAILDEWAAIVAGASTQTVWAGGMSVADKDTIYEETDQVQSAFVSGNPDRYRHPYEARYGYR